jgi:ankyrin repeat protein
MQRSPYLAKRREWPRRSRTPFGDSPAPPNLSTRQKAIQLLLAHGGIFPGDKSELEQACLLAVAQGDVKKVEDAVKRGASVNATEAEGFTPLIISATLGYDDLTRWLLSRGADLNARTWDGRTPLLMALASRHADIVDLVQQLIKGQKKSGTGDRARSSQSITNPDSSATNPT